MTSKDVVSKRLSFSVGGMVSAFASFCFALPFYLVLLAVLWLAGLENFAMSWRFLAYVFLRSCTDVVAEWAKMSAFSFGDISVVSCFISFTPAFLLFTSPLITGDSIPPLGIAAVLVIFLGSLLLVYRRDAAGEAGKKALQSKAIGFALLAALFFSLNACFDRLAALSASAALSGFSMTLLSAVFIAPFVLPRLNARRELFLHRRPFLLRGIIEVAFMVTKLVALQHLQAPYVVGIQKVSLIFSIIAGRVVYKEEQFGKKMFAGAVMLSGVVLIILAQSHGH